MRRLYYTKNVLILILLLVGCSKSEHDFAGYVEADLIYLSSPYSGILKHIYHHRGSHIENNVLLYDLDPEPEISSLAQAKANLEEAQATLKNAQLGSRETIIAGIQAQIDQAKANLNLAQLRFLRYQNLYRAHAVDKDMLDAATATLESNKANVEKLHADLAEARLGAREYVIASSSASMNAALAKVKQLQWELAQKQIFAPFAGFIFDNYYREGEFVSAATPIGSLLTPQNIYINFYVPQRFINQIKLGDKVKIHCDDCNKEINAQIDYISPEVEFTPPVIYSRESNYKYVFRIRAYPSLKDAFYLHPGQPVYVRIIF